MRKFTDAKRGCIVHITSAHPVMDIRIFHKECRSLVKAGFEVIQICNHNVNETVDGVLIVGLGENKGRVSRCTRGLLKTFFAALRCRGDLYHLHDPDLLILGVVLRVFGKRVVYDIHEDLPTKILLKMYLPEGVRQPLSTLVRHVENRVASLMTGLVTATPALWDRFEKVNRNTVVVNNFPMLEEFASTKIIEWHERAPNVGYFGGISEARGIEEMVNAVNMLPRALGINLELAGWFYVESLLERLKEQPQWRVVRWHSEVDRVGLSRLLSGVSVGLVLLHPEKSFVNSQPTKLFEYMAAGIPVIASDFPLWRAIVAESGCGLLVDPLDVSSIANAIESLIVNPDIARLMGERGRRAIDEKFNWTNEERRLLSFYSCVLNDRSVGAECESRDYSNA